jgi:ABC-type phosphate transport system substrate-binding protein
VLTAVSVGLLAPAQSALAQSYVTISGAGSTWPQNAIDAWVADVAQDGLPVNYAGVGSTTGMAQFAQGTVNFAASEIPYGVHGGVDIPTPARGYAYIPDVAGGLAFVYSLTIDHQPVTNLRLSGAAIAGIFTGQITMWNDPQIAADNPELALPATPIIPVVPSNGSGDTWEFTNWMSATESSSWTAYCQVTGLTPCAPTASYPVDHADPAMIAQDGDTAVAGYVGQSDGAIGFVSYATALEGGSTVANVLNAAGYYTAPTAGNVGVSLLNAQLNSDETENLSPVYTDTDPRTYELSYYSYLIVPTGAFTFSAPVNATISMTVSGDTATGTLVPVTVSDTRNTYPGWVVLGQMSDFTNPASNPAGDIPGKQLGWAPTSTSLADGAVLGPTIAPGNLSPFAELAGAVPGTGYGTSTLGANLTLAIPPSAPSGSYAGVLTLTAEPGSS